MPICSKTEATLRPRRERNVRPRRERNVKGNRAQGNLFCVRESPRGSVIAAGAAAIVGGKIAHSTVSEQLAQERIDVPCQGGVEAPKTRSRRRRFVPASGRGSQPAPSEGLCRPLHPPAHARGLRRSGSGGGGQGRPSPTARSVARIIAVGLGKPGGGLYAVGRRVSGQAQVAE